MKKTLTAKLGTGIAKAADGYAAATRNSVCRMWFCQPKVPAAVYKKKEK